MSSIESIMGVDFFTYVLPWLLTFAVVYGITSHIGEGGMPKNKAARAIIALALAFIVAPTVSPWVTVFMKMAGSMMIIITGLLVFIIFLEVMGIGGRVPVIEGGKKVGEAKVSIFQAHGVAFAILFIIIGALVFIGSGGLEALGWRISPTFTYNWPLITFLIIVALAIWWMTSE